MEKLKMQSPNLVEENIDRIAQWFPNCITEDRDEKGKLRRQWISTSCARSFLQIGGWRPGTYSLSWPGKNEAILAANAPIAKTLRPCEEESVDFEGMWDVSN